MKIPFAQVDAFADRAFAGNPAAVMLLDVWRDDGVLQAMAAENNLAETAFLVPTIGDADYELRWFSPTVEVMLCGHATLASGHYLLNREGGEAKRFRTRHHGVLTVARDGDIDVVDLPALSPDVTDDRRSADALGVTPVALLFRAGGYYVTVLGSEADVRALRPDFRALVAAVAEDAAHIVTAPGDQADFVTRVFAPSAGIDEDSVTGSAHAVLTPYWAARLGRNRLTAHQLSTRGGALRCEIRGDRVLLGGPCVTVIEGHFIL